MEVYLRIICFQITPRGVAVDRFLGALFRFLQRTGTKPFKHNKQPSNMFTTLTMSAVSILHAINIAEERKLDSLSPLETRTLLDRLTSGGFIRLMPGKPCDDLTSYYLVRPLEVVTMLSLLDTLGEGLNSVHYLDSDFYVYYGLAARKLGIINQVTRTCLSEISISEISLHNQTHHHIP